MKLKNNHLFSLFLVVPTFLVFRAFFLSGPLAWGDAPFYNQEALRQLFNEPYAWVNYSIAGLGRVNNLYWIYPISLAYASLHKFLGLSNDLLIRLMFYFPALLGSLITPILLIRYLGFSRVVQFFASLVYTFNTFFILLIDGGQVGVALAYGIFPLTLLFLRRLRDNPTFVQSYKTLGVFMLLSFADARIAIVCLFALLVWSVAEIAAGTWKPEGKHLRVLLFFFLSVLGLSMYWLYPAAKLLTGAEAGVDKPLELLSLLNALFLFQPHWPANEFGKVFPTPFYFVGIPLLTFGSLITKNKQNYIFAFCFLLFAFLTKGAASPLGGFYELVTNHLPLGSAFRDSSKFFIPTVLFGSILIGMSLDKLFLWASNHSKAFGKVLVGVAASYLLLLVSPALRGQLSGVLAARSVTSNFEAVNDLIRGDPGSFRTVWFPENHPWSYTTFKKPAIDAKSLVNWRPFAAINTGTFDRFNFLHDPLFIDWFQLLGIKYLVFSGEQRKTLSAEDQGDWSELLGWVAQKDGVGKVNPGAQVPVYTVGEIRPRIFAVDKLAVVVGPDDIYKKLKNASAEFSVGNHGFVFVEDGKFNPSALDGVLPESAVVVFNGKTDLDLAMSFLQEYFISPVDATKGVAGPSQWALRSSQDYLQWKYELLVNGIDTTEFDYGKGIAFSSVVGEWIYFDVPVAEDDEYVLVARVLTKDRDDLLEVSLFYSVPMPFAGEGRFEWYTRDGFSLKRGVQRVAFKNVSGFHAINTLGLIPKKRWQDAWGKARKLTSVLETQNIGQSIDQTFIGMLRDGKSPRIDHKFISPVEHEVVLSGNSGWIVFTDSYNQQWQLKIGQTSVAPIPIYSMVNGFRVNGGGRAKITFGGQKDVRWGLGVSVLSFMVLTAMFLWKHHAKNT